MGEAKADVLLVTRAWKQQIPIYSTFGKNLLIRHDWYYFGRRGLIQIEFFVDLSSVFELRVGYSISIIEFHGSSMQVSTENARFKPSTEGLRK